MMATMLYHKRFFPYYVHNIIGGIDSNGKGAAFSFDPVGSYERESCRAGGSAASLIQPFLDNQIKFKNLSYPLVALPREKVIQVIKDAFTSATERDIYTGDGLQIMTITKEGVKEERYPLKRD
jgi:20S proteasome subunit beta 6